MISVASPVSLNSADSAAKFAASDCEIWIQFPRRTRSRPKPPAMVSRSAPAFRPARCRFQVAEPQVGLHDVSGQARCDVRHRSRPVGPPPDMAIAVRRDDARAGCNSATSGGEAVSRARKSQAQKKICKLRPRIRGFGRSAEIAADRAGAELMELRIFRVKVLDFRQCYAHLGKSKFAQAPSAQVPKQTFSDHLAADPPRKLDLSAHPALENSCLERTTFAIAQGHVPRQPHPRRQAAASAASARDAPQ